MKRVYYLHYIKFNGLLNYKLLLCFHTFATSENLKDHMYELRRKI